MAIYGRKGGSVVMKEDEVVVFGWCCCVCGLFSGLRAFPSSLRGQVLRGQVRKERRPKGVAWPMQ